MASDVKYFAEHEEASLSSSFRTSSSSPAAQGERGSGMATLVRRRMALAFFLCCCFWAVASNASSTSSKTKPTTPKIKLPNSILHSLAQYSPEFPVEKYRSPKECKLTQVNIIQRHGARFPTASAGKQIQSAVQKLQSVQTYSDKALNFLHTYQYDLGADDLIPYGAAESFDAGQEAFERYGSLLNSSNLPFVRASSSTRVVQSATNWTAGFAFASQHHLNPTLSVVLSEAGNDTLDDNMCPNAGSPDAEDNAWIAVFAPKITARLNAAASGANLTDADTVNLISLCSFDSLAKEEPSPWCGVFGKNEFVGFEYFGDLSKYYGTGYGQELGPVQGVGYINELIARLTGKPVQDATQTNRTLDSSPETFPLDRSLYADFSHDNQMIAIYAALDLFKQSHSLDPQKPDPHRSWVASKLVPFAARLVTERLDCDGRPHVRMLVNDAVQPLAFCGAQGDGLCDLNMFVKSQIFATSNGAGKFEQCFS